MSDFTVGEIERSWRTDASRRTVLYYSYLLSEQSKAKKNNDTVPRSQVQEITSIERGDFDSIIQDFVYFGVLNSENDLRVTTQASEAIKQLFIDTFGDAKKVPFNGLSIYQANPKERYRLWVEEGTRAWQEIFSTVPDIRFKSIEVGRKRGKLLVIQTDISQPFLVIYFINTPRMKQMSEIEPLRACSDEILFARMREIDRTGGAPELNGLKPISIVAAPTYSASTAQEAASSEVPARLTGPINLGALLHYFDSTRPCLRERQFNELVRFLDPVSGGIRGGILISDLIVEYLESRLEKEYIKAGC